MRERRLYGKRLLLLIVIVFAMSLSPVQGSLAVFQDSTSVINNAFYYVPTLTDYTMSELVAISDDIRANGANSSYYSEFYAYAAAGNTVSVTLADGSPSTATLVDAKAGYGLVFMLNKVSTIKPMNASDTNSGGWAASALRDRIVSGDLYSTYLDGMTMSLADATDQAVVPAQVTIYSADYNGGTPQELATSGETFFLPSTKEIVGSSPDIEVNGVDCEPDCSQFAYFANLGVTYSSYSALDYDDGAGYTKAEGSRWWLRSASVNSGQTFCDIRVNGWQSTYYATYSRAVCPCFCLGTASGGGGTRSINLNIQKSVEEPDEKTAQEPTEESNANTEETKSANEVDEQAVNEAVDGSESQQESDNLTNVNEANHEPIEIYADADISTGEVIIPLSSFSFTPDIDTLDWHEDVSAISDAVIKEDNLIVTVATTVLEQYGRVISGYITDSNNESSGNIYIRIVNSSK